MDLFINIHFTRRYVCYALGNTARSSYGHNHGERYMNTPHSTLKVIKSCHTSLFLCSYLGDE